MSILIYSCESSVLTNALFGKPYIFGKSLIHLTIQALLRDTIRECHLKLTDHCIRMQRDEPVHLFVFYDYKIMSSHRQDQIIGISIEFHPYSIKRYGANFFKCLRIKSLLTNLISPYDDEDNKENNRFYLE